MLRLALFSLRRPLRVLAALALATVAVAAGLCRLQLRTDGAAVYPTSDPVVEQTQRDRATFGEAEQLILLVTSRVGGPSIASPVGFRFLRDTQSELDTLPGVEPGGVRSLVTLLEPPDQLSSLRIETFFDGWSGGGAGFAGLLARIQRLPVASGLFLSPGGRAAVFYLPLARDTGRSELLDELRHFIARRAAAPFVLRLTGPVVAESDLGEEVLHDLSRLVPVMVAAVALLLWLTLRTVGGVLIPLAQVLTTLVWTLGLMGWSGVPMTLVTTVMPVLLMAMVMTDEIYLLERLQDHLSHGARRAAAAAFTDLTAPLVLISLTTAAGFFSFLGAAVAPLRHLGLFTGLGLLLGMLFTFTLAPALIAVLPVRWVERRRRRDRRGALGWELATVRHPRATALATAALLAMALPGLWRLRVQDSWVDNFDPRSPLVTAERRFNSEFWGSYRFDVVFAGDRGAFWTAQGVSLLEDFHRWARTAPHVGGALSVLLPFEIAARARDQPLPVSRLPPIEIRRAGAVVEVLRLRLRLQELLTVDQDQARVRLFVRDADYAKAHELQDAVEAELPRLLAGRAIRAHVSGDVPLALAVVGSVVSNQLRSIVWTAALIAVLLLLGLRNWRLAVVVMAPVLAATLLLFAVLGCAGVPLGIATSMFAALTLGAGVDFAVQYVFAYRRERGSGLSHREALVATLCTTGRGLRWNALVLALGISVLGLSAIKPNSSLGLLLAAAMVVAYATTLALLPQLLALVAGARSQG
ncbi:MAG TPA: MMPL family transporter [Thermoanaerobaculia bacterium]|nr:MMPL family transporter [Thermoanaerobaculia bacterium]